MGRPTKLDDATGKAILTALSAGTAISTACQAAGIGTTTFKTWMARGRSESTDDAPYRSFRSSVKKARAAAQVHALTTIYQAMRHHWQAAAWYLERSDPKRWGRKAPMAVPTEEGRRPITLNIISHPGRACPTPLDQFGERTQRELESTET